MAEAPKTTRHSAATALVLSWLIPGAGHVYVGLPARGIIIFLTIAATFWAGIAIGGVMTVDPITQRWWFVAEMLTGAHGLVCWYRQHEAVEALVGSGKVHLLELDKRLAEANLALVSPTDTVARAYSAVAGLLNLMCIFDAVILALMGKRRAPGGVRRT